MTYFFLTVMFLSTSAAYARAGHFPQVFNKLRVGRYPQRISFHHTPLRLQDTEQFFSFYENLPMRKQNGGKSVTSFLPPKVKDGGDSFGNVFDANGMIVLTMPRDDEDRLLNQLLNDVVYYKADKNEKALRDKKRGNVRKGGKIMKNLVENRSEDGFDLEDSKQNIDGEKVMKNILRSDLYDRAATPKLVFDFNEIVG